MSNPTVGLLNLMTEKAAEVAHADAIWLSHLFDSVMTSSSAVPRCDVLFLYAEIAADDGLIIGSVLGLREIVRDSGARIVVVASENPADAYIKAGAQRPYGQANLVMTLDRRGSAFGWFFEQLFASMQNGISMPEAWMQLNPVSQSESLQNLQLL